MAEVTLIQEGYAREINSVFHARCTVCLISLRNAVNETFEFEKQKPEISPVQNVLFDCGAAHERDTITEKLSEKNISAIDAVFCSHGHSDHVGNLNLFPSALAGIQV
ncbi:Oidioi.mRNA.OKI2018_I69.XSR.g15000.t2.cds [Oikopleura dioica]|uniref:Metallo-beta-lactamase domain-containing protein 1 n=1 Tax=Oikopleura dioica TaxID=34765 RepID=A0ABN7SHS9_OIKDI|nr:Oidioi.mRNA.OKI2018_I69.XSR.g15000.t2.cds [Oikopleura dioica]